MDRIQYIPLGSVVQLKGGTQKLLVVARGLNVTRGDKQFFFDYGGVLYPQGLTGDEIAYFNHDAIRALLFIGCNDMDSQAVVEAIHSSVEQHPEWKRCTPEEWAAAQADE